MVFAPWLEHHEQGRIVVDGVEGVEVRAAHGTFSPRRDIP
jgi:hypothetical protein